MGYVLLTIKSTNQVDSAWILILILVIGILFNYSYRLGNIDQYIKTIIEKLSNLESSIENIKKKEVEDAKEKKVDPIIIKKELIAPTYLNKENTIPDKVIEKPKISKMMDPREQIKLKEEKNNSNTK